jgi:hypothetical protein
VVVVSAGSWLKRWAVDQEVVLYGNLLLFIISLISYRLAQKGLKNPNPHAFVRSVYTGIMIKLFVCIIAAFIYISAFRASLNKPGLFICMGLYLIYTFTEVSLLMKQLSTKIHEQS